jgi:putative phosphoserine phosphatase/1-acylglycerol-3-phosphate O-acyltransferase
MNLTIQPIMEAKAKRYVAFFDLDKTLLSINSGSALVREAYKRKLMSTSDLLNAIYLSWLYKFNLRDTSLIVSGMGRWLKGVTVDEANVLSEHVVNKHLVNAIRPEIYSEIRFHKENNAEIVILSSAIIQICRPLGSYIGVDDIICTVMEVADGVFTGSAENKFCFEDEKRIRLMEYCKTRNYSLNEAFYYGDSISDLSALKVVGHPVCVQPDRKLSRISHENGWRIL